MQNLTVMLFLGSLLINTLMLQAEAQADSFSGTRKVTKIHFYLQDVVGGDNRNVYEVARSNITGAAPSMFGAVYVADNPITSSPEVNSEFGRFQGIAAFADLDERALVYVVNVVFTQGKYKGSTLSILGRNPIDEKIREVPVVGGTGAFRMASGYAITSTFFVDPAGIRNVYEFNVVVFHMDA